MLEMNKIYNLDCLIGLKQIADNSIDLVVTDPPYGIDYQSNQAKKYHKYEKLPNDNNEFRFLIYPELYRVLKNNSACTVFASWKNFADDFKELEKLFKIQNVVIWNKSGGGHGGFKKHIVNRS